MKIKSQWLRRNDGCCRGCGGPLSQGKCLGICTSRRSSGGWLKKASASAAAILAALVALPVSAGTILAHKFDIDSTTYTCPMLCTPPSTSRVSSCPGDGYSDARKITTSGVSTTTITAVSSNGAFGLAAVGDLIVVKDSTGAAQRLVVKTKASANSITVDTAITIPSAGEPFRLWTLTTGTAAGSGWTTWTGTGDGEVFLSFDQVSDTGGVDYKVEGRGVDGNVVTLAHALAGPTNVATATPTGVGIPLDKKFVDQIRACFKVTTADDDVVTITAATNDAIDFEELTNITITAGVNDAIDFVEDPAGTPDTCETTLAAGSYTASVLATHVQGRINTVSSCSGAGPTNTYGVTWSAVTRKFTVARTAGALDFDLPWLTGVNAATSVAATMGYTADDTGATSYAADNTTYSSGELTATLDPGLYATGSSVCAEVSSEMQSAAVASTISCAYSSSTDKITISATGITSLSILWATGTNNATSADTPLGYAADSTGALSYAAPTALGLDASNEVESISVLVNKR